MQSEPRAAKKPLDLATQKSLESTEQIWWDKPTNAPPSTAKEVPTPGMAFTLPREAPVPASAPMRMTLGKLVPFFELLFPYL